MPDDVHPPSRSTARLVCSAAGEAFLGFRERFAEITRRARGRFEARDWRAAHADAIERLDLYSETVDALVASVRDRAGGAIGNPDMWRVAKRLYARTTASSPAPEIAETFFNSLTRKIFSTVGVNPAREFVDTELDRPGRSMAIVRSIPVDAGLPRAIEHLLLEAPLTLEPDVVRREAALAAASLHEQLDGAEVETIEVLAPIFYRDSRAYVAGRMRVGARAVPLLIALRHPPSGIEVDAVLTSEDEVSIVFSFARSYFHVDAESPREVVAFLRSIMPRKPTAELYIAIGYHKHGKTELYRSLRHHLARSDDRFDRAPGEAGLVMLVFTLPSLDIVFKVIRDQPSQPKRVTRRDVLDRYRLVFTHDRVGRLVDAQDFEHLRFPRERFEETLLDQLLEHAGGTVSIEGDDVVIRHLFTERRVVPLNLFLNDGAGGRAREAVLDFGRAIKDLAEANIFPGDLLLKNFGVTRHGRVVFYDYDELCLLTDCRFRVLPEARTPEEEMSSEPWFFVAESDIFPEEFRTFLGLSGPLRDAFLEAHSDLFEASFWQSMQERRQAGVIVEERPYPPERRLKR